MADGSGLLAYLMGLGRAEEHRRPRVVATWDGRDTECQPAATGSGEWDLELGPLIRLMRAPRRSPRDCRTPLIRMDGVGTCGIARRGSPPDHVLSDAKLDL
jgi:hypothetical protein